MSFEILLQIEERQCSEIMSIEYQYLIRSSMWTNHTSISLIWIHYLVKTKQTTKVTGSYLSLNVLYQINLKYEMNRYIYLLIGYSHSDRLSCSYNIHRHAFHAHKKYLSITTKPSKDYCTVIVLICCFHLWKQHINTISHPIFILTKLVIPSYGITKLKHCYFNNVVQFRNKSTVN